MYRFPLMTEPDASASAENLEPADIPATEPFAAGATAADSARPQSESSGGRNQKRDLTTGPLLTHVVKLSLPTMGAIAFHASYSIADTIWVGRYLGKEAIAAISIWFFLFMVFIFFNQVFGVGSVALISQTYGAKEYEKTKIVIGQTFMFKIYMALIVTILGWIFVDDVYRAFIADPEVQRLGITYSLILFTALPIYFSGFTLNTSFHGIGDMLRPLYIVATATILNIILDPILIVGINGSLHPALPYLTPGYGIAGAAYATVIAQALTFSLGLFIFFSGRTYLKMELKYLGRPIWLWIWKIVRIGTPTAIGETIRNIAQLAIGKLVALFGTAIFAAQGIMGQFFMLLWIPLGGVGQAVVTLVGQNLGAGKPERSEESVWKSLFVALAIIVPVIVFGYVFAPALVSVFNKEPEVIHAGTQILRVILFAFLPLSVTAILGSAFWGSGDTVQPMIVGVAEIYFIQLPLIFMAVKLAGNPLVRLNVLAGAPDPVYYGWWAVVVGETVAAVAIIWVFKLGLWKKPKI